MEHFSLALSRLRKPTLPALRQPPKLPPKVFHFQILTIGEDLYLRTVDEKGASVKVDYRTQTGTVRELLRSLENEGLEDFGGEAFSWGGDAAVDSGDVPEGSFALIKRPQLLRRLLHCNRVVDGEMQEIRLHRSTRELLLSLNKQENGKIRSRLALRNEDGTLQELSKPLVPADGFAFDGLDFYTFEPIGEEATALPLFAEDVPEKELAPFLTIFASRFPSASIEFPGVPLETGSTVEARPAIAFLEVDENASLLIELPVLVAGVPDGLLKNFEIDRVVSYEPEIPTLRLREVDQWTAFEAHSDFRASLKRLARSNKTPGAFLQEDEERGLLILGAPLAEQFLREQLVPLSNRFVLLGTENLRRYKVVHGKPKVHMKLNHGIDFLEGEADLEVAGERFSLLDALRHYRKNRFLLLSDGSQALIDPEYMARLERVFQKKKQGLRVSVFDLPIVEELIRENQGTSQLPASRGIFEGFNHLHEREVPVADFHAQLRPYQSDGLRWLDYLHENRLGGCLADDMGLGKTVQAIALLCRLYPAQSKPTLIIMPRSLLFNWTKELSRFAPRLNVAVFYGSNRGWAELFEGDKPSPHIILTTYGTLRSDIEAIAQTSLHAVILDESQAIKNTQTQTFAAVLALKTEFRLALSGTPVENHLGEVFALFRFLNPAMFASQAEFERNYLLPIQKHGDETATRDLRRKIFPFILRRLKKDVLKELPPKVEQTLFVEMNAAQKAHYKKRRQFYHEIIHGEIASQGLAKSQFVVLEALLELRQIASVPESKTEGEISSAKIERLLEALEESVENNHKCLVFSNFIAGVDLVSEALAARRIGHVRMTGATTDRESLVQRFQNDPRTKAFVMTLKTGGVGLNLTAADTVFLLDPWWNTSAENQAVDRAHRIGQTGTVFTYRLIARETIEEKILLLQQQKKDLVDQIITSDSGAIKKLTEEDISFLFND